MSVHFAFAPLFFAMAAALGALRYTMCAYAGASRFVS